MPRIKPLLIPLAAAAALTAPLLALAHGISDADRQRMLDGGLLQYIGLGASHMLTGYDHLLFLFGVVFFLTTFKDIAKFVTGDDMALASVLVDAASMFTRSGWLVGIGDHTVQFTRLS